MLDLPILQSQTQNARSSASGGPNTADDSTDAPAGTPFEREYQDASKPPEVSEQPLDASIEADGQDTAEPGPEPDAPPASETTEINVTEVDEAPSDSAAEPEDVFFFATAETSGKANRPENEVTISRRGGRIIGATDNAPPDEGRDRNVGNTQMREQSSQPALDALSDPKSKQPLANRSTAETVIITRAIDTSKTKSGRTTEGPAPSEATLGIAEGRRQSAETDASSPSVAPPARKSQDAPKTLELLPQGNDARIPAKANRNALAESMDAPPGRSPSAAPSSLIAIGNSQIVQPKIVPLPDNSDTIKYVVDDFEIPTPLDQRATQHSQSTQLQQVLQRSETPAMIARQMAEALQKLPDRPVEISLNPRELGRVRMNISATEAGITVSVIAERPETLDLMRRNIDQLAREFEMIGYNDINFAFSQGEAQQEFSGEHKDATHTAASPIDLEHAEDVSPDHPKTSPTTGIDIRV